MPITSNKSANATRVSEYFALRPSTECATTCQEIIDGYYVESERSGRTALYRTAW